MNSAIVRPVSPTPQGRPLIVLPVPSDSESDSAKSCIDLRYLHASDASDDQRDEARDPTYQPSAPRPSWPYRKPEHRPAIVAWLQAWRIREWETTYSQFSFTEEEFMSDKLITTLSMRLLTEINDVFDLWSMGRPYIEDILEGLARVDRKSKEDDKIAAEELAAAEAAEKQRKKDEEDARKMLEARRSQGHIEFYPSLPIRPLRYQPPLGIIQPYLSTPGPSPYQLSDSTVKALKQPLPSTSTSGPSVPRSTVQSTPKRARLSALENTPPRRARPFPLDSPSRTRPLDGSPSKSRMSTGPREGTIRSGI